MAAVPAPSKVFYGAAKGRPGELLDLRCACCGSPLHVRAIYLLDLPTNTVEVYGVDCAARLLGRPKPSSKKVDDFVFEANSARAEALPEGVVEAGVLAVGSRKYRFARHDADGRVWYRVSAFDASKADSIVSAVEALRGERTVWSFASGNAVWVEVAC